MRVAVSSVHFDLGPTGSPFVHIADGQGSLLINRTGIAADFSVSASFPGLAAAGLALNFQTVRLQLNTTAAAVNETFAVGGQTLTLDLPVGPFLRVTVLGATLKVGGASGFDLIGDFLFDQTGTAPNATTRIGLANIAVTIDGQGIKNGAGAFTLKPAGIAGILTGEASVAAGPVSVGGSFGVRINTTTAAVDETITIGAKTINVRFSDTEVKVGTQNFAQFFGGDLSLNIGNFVTIEGNVSFSTIGGKTVFAGEGLNIFLGQGPSKLSNGEANPLATGLLVSNASIGLIKFPNGTYALAATGSVAVVGFNGITVSGNVLVRFNNSGQIVNETLTIPNTVRNVLVKFDTTALVTTFEATQLNLSVVGQTLTGDFAFSKQTVAGAQVISVAAKNVSLSLGDGATSLVNVTGAEGALLLTPTGAAGSLSNAQVALNVPGVQFTGTFSIAVNGTTTAVDKTFTVGTGTVAMKLPAGPFLSVKADNVTLAVAGQLLAGSFALEQIAQSGGTKITRVAASGVTLKLGDATTDFVSVTNGRGSFLVTSAGLAGRLDADVALNIPAISFSGAFGISVNNTTAAVMQTFTVGGTTTTLNLPAGPYVRVDAVGAKLTVGGQTLGGDFAFEKVTRAGFGPTVRLGANNVTLKLGDGTTDLVSLTNGAGSLLVTNAGVAGSFSANILTNIPGVSLSGALSLQINNTNAAVNETLMVGSASVSIVLPAGPFVRIAGTGVSMNVLGQSIAGDFAIERSTNNRGESKLRVAIANARLALGDGTDDLVVISGASAYFVVTSAGIAGSFTGSVAVNIPNVSFSGSFTAEVNNTSAGIDESFVVGAATVALKLPAGPFLRVGGTGVSLNVAGQTLTGNFVLQQSMTLAGGKVVRIAVSGVSLKLGDGTTDFVSLTNGNGAFLITPAGIAGSLSVSAAFNIPGVQISGDVSVQVNNTAAVVKESFVVAGTTIVLDLPAGPYVRVAVYNTNLIVGGVLLRGDFAFDQSTRADGKRVTRIALANVEVSFGGQGIKNADGAFVITPTGVAGIISGDIAIAAGGASIGGRAGFRVNKSGGAVDETIDINGRTISVKFTAGEGDLFAFFAEDLTLNIGNFVTIEGSVSFVNLGGKLTFAGTNLAVFLGQGPGRLANGEINPSATGILLTEARIGLIKYPNGTVAFFATGKVQVLGLSGIVLSSQATVRVNTTGLEIHETLTIPNTADSIALDFSDTQKNVTTFQALNTDLQIVGQKLHGDFAFDKVTSGAAAGSLRIAATNVSIGLGDGTTDLLSVTNGSGSLLLTPAGVAGSFAATVATNIPGFTLGVGTLGLAVNTTPAPVVTTFYVGAEVVTLDVPAGPFLRVSGDNVTISVAGQSLSGNFAFEQTGSALTGNKAVRLALTHITVSIKSGTQTVVSLTNGEGIFAVKATGFAGRVSGTVAIDPALGFSFRGIFALAINSGTAAVQETFTIGNRTFALTLPAGPYLRIEGTGVELDVQGITLSGDFAFERVTKAGTTESRVRVGLANIRLALGDAASPVLEVTGGSGFFLVTPTVGTVPGGFAGTFTATIQLNVPSITLGGTFTVVLNNTANAVDETFLVGVGPVSLKVDAGPYLKVAGTGVSVGVLGQTLSGNFAFEQNTVAGAKRIRFNAANVSLNLGAGAVTVTGGTATFLVTSAGFAGDISGVLAVNVPGVAFSGPIKVRVNNTAAAVNQTFANPAATLSLPAGPYLRVEIGDGATLGTLNVLGQTISANFVLEQSTRADGSKAVRVAISNGTLKLGGTDAAPLVSVSQATGFLLLTPAGLAGKISASVALNVPDMTFSGVFSIELNNTSAVVKDSVSIGTSTLALDLPAGPYLRVAGSNVVLGIAGQSLTGNFSFEQFARGTGPTATKLVRIAFSNVGLSLGDGTNTFLTVTGGTGYFILRPAVAAVAPDPAVPAGIAGTLNGAVALNVPGVTLSGTLSLKVNTLPVAVTETFTVGGTATTIDLPAGSYVRLEGTGLKLGVSGVTLEGDFAFEQLTSTPAAGTPSKVVRISLANVSFGLGDGTNDFVKVTNGSGDFILKTTGIGATQVKGLAGQLNATVAVNIPGVTFDASFSVQVKTLDAAIHETFSVNTPTGLETRTLDIPTVGQFLRVTANDAKLNVLGQQLGGTFAVEQIKTRGPDNIAGNADDQKVVRVGIAALTLTIGPAGAPYVEVRNGHGSLLVNSFGLAGSLTIDPVLTGPNAGPGLAITLPGINVTASVFSVQINTQATAVKESFTFGSPTVTEALNLPAGPFVRVTVIGATVDITSVSGEVIRGDIFFEQGQRNEFTAALPIGTATDPVTAISAGDFNGDGRADLVVARAGQPLLVYLNSGSATPFSGAPLALPVNSNAIAIAVGDLNNDGRPDIVVGRNNAANLIFLNTGTKSASGLFTLSFGAGIALDPGAGGDSAKSTTGVALADLNGDGIRDIVVVNSGRPSVAYLNTGAVDATTKLFVLTFAAGLPLTAGTPNSTAVAVGDVNGDGRVDIVIGNNGFANLVVVNNGVTIRSLGAAPVNGKIGGMGLEFRVTVKLNGSATGTSFIITAASQADNTTAQNLVEDFTAALTGAGLGPKIAASLDGGNLVLRAVDRTVFKVEVSAQTGVIFGENADSLLGGAKYTTTLVASASGQLGGTFSFGVKINGAATPTVVIISAAAQTDNAGDATTTYDAVTARAKLVSDFNDALAAAGLATKIAAVTDAVDAGKISFTVIDSTVTSFVIVNQALTLFDPVSLTLTSTGALPLSGKFLTDFKFSVSINGAAAVPVTVSAAAQSTNTTPANLVSNLNAALSTAGLGSKLFAGTAGTKLTLTTSDPSVVSIAISTQTIAVFGALNATIVAGPSISSAADAPANGRLGTFFNFRLTLNGTTSPVDVAIPAATLDNNNSIADLVADLNTALAGTPSGSGGFLNAKVVAQQDGNRVRLTVIDPAVTTFTVPSQSQAFFNLTADSLTSRTAFTSTADGPASGQFLGDLTFTLKLNGASTGNVVTITAAAQSNNTSATDLLADINAALTAATIGTKVTAESVAVTVSPGVVENRLELRAIDPTVTAISLSGQSLAIFGPTASTPTKSPEFLGGTDLPANGSFGADLIFTIQLNGGAVKTVTVTAAAQQNNADPVASVARQNLVNDINGALVAAGIPAAQFNVTLVGGKAHGVSDSAVISVTLGGAALSVFGSATLSLPSFTSLVDLPASGQFGSAFSLNFTKNGSTVGSATVSAAAQADNTAPVNLVTDLNAQLTGFGLIAELVGNKLRVRASDTGGVSTLAITSQTLTIFNPVQDALFDPAKSLVLDSANANTATTALALGDVNGDGKLDLVVGKTGQQNVVYINSGGSVPFASSINIGTAPFAVTAIALGDVNGDGRVDAILGGSLAQSRIFLNKGDAADPFGGVTAMLIGAATNQTTGLLLVDLDRDGDLDLIGGNNGQGVKLYSNGVKVSRFAFANLELSFSGQGIKNGSGAAIITTTGFAGVFTGEIDLSVGGGSGVSAGGTVAVSVNTTGSDIDEMIAFNGQVFPIKLLASPTIKFTIGDFIINIGGFVTIESKTITLDPNGGSGVGVTIFLGQGPATLDGDTPNPAAKGLLISNARFVYQKNGFGQFALFAEGTVSVVGIPDLTLSGLVSVVYNSTRTAAGSAGNSTIATLMLDGQSITIPADAVGVSGALNLGVAGQTLSGNFSFDIMTLPGADGLPNTADDLRQIKAGAANVHLGLGDGTTEFVSVNNGRGAFIISPSGLAGSVSANIALNVPGAVTFTGAFTLNINNTPNAVVQSVNVPVVEVATTLAALGVTLGAGPQLKITNRAGASIPVDLTGALTLADVISRINATAGAPFASLDGRSIKLVDTSTQAGSNRLKVEQQGASLAAQQLGLLRTGDDNTAHTQDVLRGLPLSAFQTIAVNLPAGPYLKVEGAPVTLNIAGQQLSGNFAFEQYTQSATPGAPATKVVRIAVTNLHFALTAGTTDLVVLNGGSGYFVVKAAGLAGEISGTVAVPVIGFSGTLKLSINNATSAISEQFTVAGVQRTLSLPAGPYVRFEGTGLTLSVGGQTISGDFGFEQTTKQGSAEKVIRVIARNVVVRLGDGTTDFLSLTEGQASLLLTTGGLAGQLGGTVNVNIPGVALAGAFKVSLNNTTAPVLQDFVVSNLNGGTLLSTLDAGAGIPIELTLTSTIALPGDGKFGTAVSFGVNAGGTTATVTLPSATTANNTSPADFVADVNNAVAATTLAGKVRAVLAGNFLRLTIIDPTVTSLALSSSTLAGFGATQKNDAHFRVTRRDGTTFLVNLGGSVSLDDVVKKINAAAGTSFARLENSRLYLMDNTAGATTFAVTALNGFPTASALGLLNAPTVGAPGEIAGTLLANDVVHIDLVAGPFLRVEGTGVQLTVAGQTIGGDFAFEQFTKANGTRVVKAAVTNAYLGLGDPDGPTGLAPPLVEIKQTAGQAALFLVTAAGFSGRIEANPTLNFSNAFGLNNATVSVSINNTTAEIHETFVVNGQNFSLNLPVGPFLRAELKGAVVGTPAQITVVEQTLSGNFSFEQATNSVGQKRVRLAATQVSLNLGGFVQISDGRGGFLISPDGLAGTIGAEIAIGNLPAGVSFAGAFAFSINNSGKPVNETFSAGSVTVELHLPAGPYVRVEGKNIALSVAGQTLSGDFAIENVTFIHPITLAVTTQTRISAANVHLGLGDGTTEFVTLDGGNGYLILFPANPTAQPPTPAALAAKIGGTVTLHIPGVSFAGTFGLEINTGTAPINETLTFSTLDGSTVLTVLNNRAGIGNAIVLKTATAIPSGGRFIDPLADPVSGSVSAEVVFLVKINGVAKAVTVTAAAQTDNQQAADKPAALLADVNAALSAAGLSAQISASITGGLLTFSATDPGVSSLSVSAIYTLGVAARSITSTTVLPTNGNYNADVSVTLTLNGVDTIVTFPISSNLPNATKQDDNLLPVGSNPQANLVADWNAVLTAKGLGSKVVAEFVDGANGALLRLRVIDATVTTFTLTTSVAGLGFVTGAPVASSLMQTIGLAPTAGKWTGGANVAFNFILNGVTTAVTLGGQSASTTIGTLVTALNSALGTAGLSSRVSAVAAGALVEFKVTDATVTVFSVNVGLIGERQSDSHLKITRTGGATGFFNVNLGGALTLGDVVTRINSAATAANLPVVAGLTTDGRLKVVDNGAGATAPSIADLGGFTTATKLKLTTADGATASGSTFLGGKLVTVPPQPFNLVGGPFLKITGTAVKLTIAGQTLQADFGFEQVTKAPAQKIIRIAVANLQVHLGDGTTEYVTVTQNSGDTGSFVVTPQGIAGQLAVHVTVQNIPGFGFSGDVSFAINNTTVAVNQSFTLGSGQVVTLALAAGPFVRVEIGSANAPATLNIAGQDITGNFSFEQVTLSPTARTIRIAASNVSLKFTDGATDFLTLTGGSLLFVVRPAISAVAATATTPAIPASAGGIAGSVSGTVTIDVDGNPANAPLFTGTLTLSLNNTTTAVSERFTIAGQTQILALPAGPYLRVDATGISVSIAGQEISGDFSFAKQNIGTPTAPVNIMTIAIANAALRLGDGTTDFVRVSRGRGGLVVKKLAGGQTVIAGSFSATVELNVPGVTFSGGFGVSLNTSADPSVLTQTFTVGAVNSSTLLTDLRGGGGVAVEASGPHFKITRRDGTSFNVNLIGSLTVGDVIGKINAAAGATMATLESGAIKLTDTTTGATPFAVTALNGSFTASSLGLLSPSVAGVITGGALNAFSISVPGGNYVKVSGTNVMMSIAGQTLGGNFSFEKVGVAPNQTVRIMASNVHLGLGDGTTDFVTVTNGHGSFIITAAGVAGELGADVGVQNIPDVGFSGTFALRINTTSAAVNLPLSTAAPALLKDIRGGDGLPIELTITSTIAAPANGKFASDVSVTLNVGGTVQQVTVTAASMNENTTTANLVADFNAALGTAGLGSKVRAELFGTFLRFRVIDTTVTSIALTASSAPAVTGFASTQANDAHVKITRRDGVTFNVNLAGAVSVSDVLTRINSNAANTGGKLTATLVGDKIKLTDASVAVAGKRLNIVGLNGLGAAALLGLSGTATGQTTQPDTITGLGLNTLTLPAGPYLRVEGTDIALDGAGHDHQRKFRLRAQADGCGSGDRNGCRDEIGLQFKDSAGAPLFTLTEGNGVLVVTPGGIAGSFSVKASVTIPDFSLSGTIGFALNTLMTPIDQTFTLNGASTRLNVPAGPYVRVTAYDATATFAGLTLAGDFFFDQSTRPDGTKLTRIAVSRLSFTGAGADDLPVLKNAGATLVIKADGIAGTITGDVALGGRRREHRRHGRRALQHLADRGG